MTKLFWSRRKGEFVNKLTGKPVDGCRFTGTIREWWETLVETVIDVAAVEEMKEVDVWCASTVAPIIYSSIVYKPDSWPRNDYLKGHFSFPDDPVFEGVGKFNIFLDSDWEMPANEVWLCKPGTKEKVGKVEVIGIPSL